MSTPDERYDYCFSSDDHERRNRATGTAVRIFTVHLDGNQALSDLQQENSRLREQLRIERLDNKLLSNLLFMTMAIEVDSDNSDVQETP